MCIRDTRRTSCPVSSAIRCRSRCARGTPRVWIPTSATRSRWGLPSTISCAIRVRLLWIASASSRIFSADTPAWLNGWAESACGRGQAGTSDSFPASLDRVKGVRVGQDCSGSCGRRRRLRCRPSGSAAKASLAMPFKAMPALPAWPSLSPRASVGTDRSIHPNSPQPLRSQRLRCRPSGSDRRSMRIHRNRY
jgi:hypothetical protein